MKSLWLFPQTDAFPLCTTRYLCTSCFGQAFYQFFFTWCIFPGIFDPLWCTTIFLFKTTRQSALVSYRHDRASLAKSSSPKLEKPWCNMVPVHSSQRRTFPTTARTYQRLRARTIKYSGKHSRGAGNIFIWTYHTRSQNEKTNRSAMITGGGQFKILCGSNSYFSKFESLDYRALPPPAIGRGGGIGETVGVSKTKWFSLILCLLLDRPMITQRSGFAFRFDHSRYEVSKKGFSGSLATSADMRFWRRQ